MFEHIIQFYAFRIAYTPAGTPASAALWTAANLYV